MSTKIPTPPCPFLDSEEGMEFHHSENFSCNDCGSSSEHLAFLEGWRRGWRAGAEDSTNRGPVLELAGAIRQLALAVMVGAVAGGATVAVAAAVIAAGFL